MKAAVVTELGAPLEIRDVPVPKPGAGQVLVRMAASGLCHTDIHAAHGDWPVKPNPPFIPGHEGVGTIEALGAGVPDSKIGQRVAIPWLGHACGDCSYCVFGADHTVNARTEDPVAAIQELGGADVAITLAASPQSFEQAFASLRRGGRLVCVALPADGTMAVPIFDTVLKGISVIGSIVGTRQDLAEVFQLHAAGRARVVTEGRKLGTVNESFAEILSGHVPARLVFEF